LKLISPLDNQNNKQTVVLSFRKAYRLKYNSSVNNPDTMHLDIVNLNANKKTNQLDTHMSRKLG